jgi:hypothetical protein
VKTKSKARQCVLGILPSLKNDQGALRQWTVRFKKSNCTVASSIIQSTQFPSVEEADLGIQQTQPEVPPELTAQESQASASASHAQMTELFQAADGEDDFVWVSSTQ